MQAIVYPCLPNMHKDTISKLVKMSCLYYPYPTSLRCNSAAFKNLAHASAFISSSAHCYLENIFFLAQRQNLTFLCSKTMT